MPFGSMHGRDWREYPMYYSGSALPQSFDELAAYTATTTFVMFASLYVTLERHSVWFVLVWATEVAALVMFVGWRALVRLRKQHVGEVREVDRIAIRFIHMGLRACVAAFLVETLVR